MTFVTPTLLAGAALVVVPIVLHLVMRRQPRLLDFPPLRLIQARREANRRKLRLRHILLLMLRCAAIALLAAALARPTIQGSAGWLGSQETPVAAVLVFDTSAAMDYRHQNRTRLEVARDTGLWQVQQLPAQSDVAVLGAQRAPPVFSVDIGAARQRIERLQITADARTLPEVIQDALRLVRESDKPRREIYVYSDLTRSSWPATGAAQLKQTLADAVNTRVYVVDVGVEKPLNSGLEGLRISGEFLAKNSPLELATELVHSGPASSRSVDLLLRDSSGSLQKRGQVTAEARDGQPVPVEFPAIMLEPGTQQGEVRIAGDDGLAWDDVRYFTIDVAPAWRVLLAASQEDRALYLKEALAPSSAQQAGLAQFICDVVGFDELGQQRLADYSAVCLLDPTPLSSDTWRALADYAQQGHGVAIFLGSHANPVSSFNELEAQQLLPAPLKLQWREATSIASDSLQHPVLAKFRAVEGSIPWQAFPVLRYWQLGELSQGTSVILRYLPGQPALVEKPLGRGRVLTMTTPVSDPPSLPGREAWNYLPTGTDPWPFLMLADGITWYLVGSGTDRLNYLAGETVVLRLNAEQQPPMVLLETPQKDRLRQSIDPQNQLLMVTSTGTLGNYRIRAGGEQGGFQRGFSVNLPPERTRLDRVTNDDLADLLGKSTFQLARNREEIVRSVSIGRVGQELYPYLITLVAMLLACEHLFANWFYRDSP